MKLFIGTGLCLTVCDIAIVELNHPAANISVRVIGPTGYEPTTKAMTVDVEDPIPAPAILRRTIPYILYIVDWRMDPPQNASAVVVAITVEVEPKYTIHCMPPLII